MRTALAMTMMLGAVTTPAAAQMWGGAEMVTVPVVLNPCLDGCTADDGPDDARPRPTTSAPRKPIPAPRSVSTRYVISPARTAANVDRFIAHSARQDPATAQQLGTLLRQPDLFARIDAEFAKRRLSRADVADLYALWWISAWQTAHMQRDEPATATLRAVRKQAAAALAVTPQFTGAGDALRQEMAEDLLIKTMLLDTAREQSKASRRWRIRSAPWLCGARRRTASICSVSGSPPPASCRRPPATSPPPRAAFPDSGCASPAGRYRRWRWRGPCRRSRHRCSGGR